MIKKILAAMLALFAAAAFAAVDANKATQAELEAIKGIGPAISAKIIDERKKGAFKDWEDMVTRVKGVGEGNAAKFSTEGLTVNGTAFAGAPAKAAAPAAKADAKVEAKPMAKADDKKADKPAMSADDKKAAAKKEKEEKAAAAKKAKEEKAAAAAKAKEDKAAAKDDKAGAKPVAAKASEAKPTK